MNRFFFIIISFLLIYDIASSANTTDSKLNGPHNLSRIQTNHIQLKKDETRTYNYKSLKNKLNQTKLRVIANPSKESDSGDLDLELLLNDKVIGSCKQLLKDSCVFDLSNTIKTYQMKFTCKNEDCLIGVIITEAREIRIEPSQTHFFKYNIEKKEKLNNKIDLLKLNLKYLTYQFQKKTILIELLFL